MIKKIISILCISLLTFSILGCGKEDTRNNKNTTPHESIKNISTNSKDETIQNTENKNLFEEENDKNIDISDIEIQEPEQVTMEAVFAVVGNWALFFNESGPFTLNGKDIQYFDIDGNVIHIENLNDGDTVEIISSGLMLESYPGQLAGTTQVKVIKNGTQEDLTPYQKIIEEFSNSELFGDALEVNEN